MKEFGRDQSYKGSGRPEHIGFVGVGIMGHGMVQSLLSAGYPISVIAHRNRSPIDDVIAKGAHEVTSYADLAEKCDTIMLCLSNSEVVESVLSELRPCLRSGTMIIDLGTSRPDAIRRWHDEFAAKGSVFIEAPVTGGVLQAAEGTLGALVGASPSDFERVAPLLKTFCRTVHHFGPPGMGNTAKLLNNFMVMGIAALTLEAFTRAEHAEIDWQKLYDVAICGSANSGVLRRIIGNAVEGDFKGYVFNVEGALKDIRYYCELSQAMDKTSVLASAIREIYAQAINDGHGHLLLSELLSPAARTGHDAQVREWSRD